MPLSFPASPTIGQNYTYGSSTWTWDGTHWRRISPGGIAGSLAPGIDSLKPGAGTVVAGTTRLSTDTKQPLVADGVSLWLPNGPSGLDASGAELITTRYGGTATTGTSQVISSSTAVDITGATSSFTMPADGRPLEVRSFLPFNVATCQLTFSVYLYGSCDNATWVLLDTGDFYAIPPNVFIKKANLDARLPHPLLASSTAAPNALTPGATVFLKAQAQIQNAGVGKQAAYNTGGITYAVGDGVTSAGKWYYCKLGYTSGATLPAADSTHWTEADVTIFEAWNVTFGYTDTRFTSTRA